MDNPSILEMDDPSFVEMLSHEPVWVKVIYAILVMGLGLSLLALIATGKIFYKFVSLSFMGL